jgi:AcrR family transcriptional regulator
MSLATRIREAALLEFGEKGLKFTMDDLSRRLGISKKTLYVEVRDKESLLGSIIDDAFASIKEQERAAAADPSLGPIEKLRKVLAVMPSFGNRLVYRRIGEIEAQYPELYARIEGRIEADWGLTLGLVEEAIRLGLLRRVDPGVLREILFATMEQMLKDDFLKDSGLGYDQALEAVLDMLFNGLLARGSNSP